MDQPTGQGVADYADSRRELITAPRAAAARQCNPGFLGPADATESHTQLAYDYDTRQALKA